MRFLGRAISRAALERGWRAHNAACWRSPSPFIVSHVRLSGDTVEVSSEGAMAPGFCEFFKEYLHLEMVKEDQRARVFRIAGPARFNAAGDLVGFAWQARQVSTKAFKKSLIKALRSNQHDARPESLELANGRTVRPRAAHMRREGSRVNQRTTRAARGLEAFASRGWQTAALSLTLEPLWHLRPTVDQLGEIKNRLTKLSDSMRHAGHPVQRMTGIGAHQSLALHAHAACAVRTRAGLELLGYHARRLFPGEHGVCITSIHDAAGWGNYIQQDGVLLDASIDRGLCSIAGGRQFLPSKDWPSLESLRAGRPDGALAPVPPAYLLISPPTLLELLGWVNSRLRRKDNQDKLTSYTEGSRGPRAASRPAPLPSVMPWLQVSACPGSSLLSFERPHARAPPSTTVSYRPEPDIRCGFGITRALLCIRDLKLRPARSYRTTASWPGSVVSHLTVERLKL